MGEADEREGSAGAGALGGLVAAFRVARAGLALGRPGGGFGFGP